jgi:hypothetical protein
VEREGSAITSDRRTPSGAGAVGLLSPARGESLFTDANLTAAAAMLIVSPAHD